MRECMLGLAHQQHGLFQLTRTPALNSHVCKQPIRAGKGEGLTLYQPRGEEIPLGSKPGSQ